MSNYPPRLAIYDRKVAYSWLRCGVVTESRAGGRNGRRVFGLVSFSFCWWIVLFGYDVVDRLVH